MSAVLALQCRPARLADAPAYYRYVTECAEDGQPLYQVAQFDPNGWLQSLLDHAEGRNLPSGYLPTTTYFALDGEEIIATLRLRHGDDGQPASGWVISVTKLAPLAVAKGPRPCCCAGYNNRCWQRRC